MNFQYTSLGYFTVAIIVQPHSILIRKKNAPSLSEKNHTLATERKTEQNTHNAIKNFHGYNES